MDEYTSAEIICWSNCNNSGSGPIVGVIEVEDDKSSNQGKRQDNFKEDDDTEVFYIFYENDEKRVS